MYILSLSKKEVEQHSPDFFFSTQEQGNERIRSLRLDKRSEDASHILDTSRLSIPPSNKQSEDPEYQADPEREWIITLATVNGELFQKEDLLKMFDYEWRSQFESELTGLLISIPQ